MNGLACWLVALNGGTVSTAEFLCTQASCEEDILLLQAQASDYRRWIASLAIPNVAKGWEWCEFRENEQLLNIELFQIVKAWSRLVCAGLVPCVGVATRF